MARSPCTVQRIVRGRLPGCPSPPAKRSPTGGRSIAPPEDLPPRASPPGLAARASRRRWPWPGWRSSRHAPRPGPPRRDGAIERLNPESTLPPPPPPPVRARARSLAAGPGLRGAARRDDPPGPRRLLHPTARRPAIARRHPRAPAGAPQLIPDGPVLDPAVGGGAFLLAAAARLAAPRHRRPGGPGFLAHEHRDPPPPRRRPRSGGGRGDPPRPGLVGVALREEAAGRLAPRRGAERRRRRRAPRRSVLAGGGSVPPRRGRGQPTLPRPAQPPHGPQRRHLGAPGGPPRSGQQGLRRRRRAVPAGCLPS